MINPCILIPIYNHKETIAGVLAQLEPHRLPCIIVNDGSNAMTRQVLIEAAAAYPWVHLIHQARNQGKGAAAVVGFLHAEAAGYSHAILIDADGQHQTSDIDRFLAAAAADPSALILGKPIFGPDVPPSRYYGRRISQWCVWAETLSTAIGDPLFGFRIYPLAVTVALLKRRPVGHRMDFDPEIAVRLYWDGVAMRNVETTVFYPKDGLSNFRMLWDNMRISWMHTRLLIGMVWRCPRLLRRHSAAPNPP